MRLTLINLWPTGGMLHYAAALANALARQPGLEVTILLPRGASTALLAPGVTPAFVDLELRHGLRHAATNVLGLLRVDRFLQALRATRPDLVHLNSSHPWLILTARLIARRWPLVATVHDVEPHPGESGLRRRLQGAVVLRHARAIAVHGEELKATLLARCPKRPAEDVVVTPHGPYTFFKEDGPTGPPDRPTVLFFGRIIAYKGLEVLLAAAPKVRERIPDVLFVVAGEGNLAPYAPLLQDHALVEVKAGYVPEDAVGALFRSATVLALPYTEASWSGVASIAHAFGLPVVATSVGCLPKAVLDGINGIVIPPRDVESLTNALVSVLSDEQLLARLSQGARETQVETWDRAAEILCTLYRRLRR